MSDTYQPIYDAVRSRISSCDVGDIVQRAAAEGLDFSWQKQHLLQEIYAVSHEHQRPSVLFRPALSRDGDQWCALLGEDLQAGLCAFGNTADEAMRNFDEAFRKESAKP